MYRLNFGMSVTMLAYLLKSALKLKLTQNEKNINYYYLSLINCDCYHRERVLNKFYFGRKNISLVARYGQQYSDLENLNQILAGKNMRRSLICIVIILREFHEP